MLGIKRLHIVWVGACFAGLLSLPRLFVYHAQSSDAASIERFKVMERKLYRGIMTPSMALTLVFGVWLWLGYGFRGGWLEAKLVLVAALVAYHFCLGQPAAALAPPPHPPSHPVYPLTTHPPPVPPPPPPC